MSRVLSINVSSSWQARFYANTITLNCKRQEQKQCQITKIRRQIFGSTRASLLQTQHNFYHLWKRISV